MKRLVFIALSIIILNSCKKGTKKLDSFVFSGKIENFKKRNIKLKGFDYEKKIKLDRKTKTFNDSLKKLRAGHYTLFVGKRTIPLYLTEIGKLNIDIDAKDRTKAPVFKGTNSKIDDYLIKKRKEFGIVVGNYQKMYAKEENEFLENNKQYYNTLLKVADSSDLPSKYLELEKRNIKYEYARNEYNYQKLHRFLTNNEEFKTDKNLKDVIKEIDINKSIDYINSHHYRKLINDYLSDLTNKKTTEDDDYYLTYLETVQTEVIDTLIKNHLIHNSSEKGLTYTTNLGEYYKKYMNYSTNKKNNREITDMYNKLKLTANGQPSPKFENYERYKDGSKISLDDLLNKNKYLYIDIWATWCGFCKKEIPLLKNFEVKYHNKNIEFVSINVDKKTNYEKWKKTVEDNEMSGIQLFAGDTEKNLKFTQDYLIKGLPRFILLDPKGNIITSNAPRPSDGERLHEIFSALGLDDN